MRKYSNDTNAQMLLSLMKEHGIKKVIASPGTTNIAIVGSMQHDEYFEMYSCVDERSAAYMACGLSAESGEPVAITCTGATASRNYLPGLTEAYYRKLPILVIAGSHGEQKVGHLHAQVIDRSQSPLDTVVFRTFINAVHDKETAWYNNVEINKALIKLKQHGGGPVLINIVAAAKSEFETEILPKERRIRLYNQSQIQSFPVIPGKGRIAIFAGSHNQMSLTLQNSIDKFCQSHDAVVFCDHTSGYQGKYRINYALVSCQNYYDSSLLHPELLIHIGEVSADTYTTGKLKPKSVWRVSADGEIRDLFKKLSCVFEMGEESFFEHYSSEEKRNSNYLHECKEEYNAIYENLPELGFGNVFVAKDFSKLLPKNSVIHFGIYNSLRSWNFFPLDDSIRSSCNVGGFGIDGACSTLIGASLADKDKIHYLVVGDLAFFYDLNSLGNRNLSCNVRILLVNNGRGIEFRKKDHVGSRFGSDADLFIAAGGHNGDQSEILVRHFSESLGIEYMSAKNEEELRVVAKRFLNPSPYPKPMILEVFPTVDDEIENIDRIRSIKAKQRSWVERMKDEATGEIKKIAKTYLKR